MIRLKLAFVMLAAIVLGVIGAVTAATAYARVDNFASSQAKPAISAIEINRIAMDLDTDVTQTVTSTTALTPSNKIAILVARFFSVPVTVVIQLHSDGWGYGEIFKLYQIARVSGKTPEEIQVMCDSGMGWGQIAKALTIRPGNAGDNLGGVVSGRNVSTDTVSSGSVTQNNKDKSSKVSKDQKSQGSVNHNRGSSNRGNSGRVQSNSGGRGRGHAKK